MNSTLSSTSIHKAPDYADFHYQEAVGNLKRLLTGPSGRGNSFDAGSVYSHRRRPELSRFRSQDFPEFRHQEPRYRQQGKFGSHYELGRFRHETTRSFKRELSVLKQSISTQSFGRPDALYRRPELPSLRPEAHLFRPEIGSFRSESVDRYRPHSALDFLPRRTELPLESSSVRAPSPARSHQLSRRESLEDGLLAVPSEKDEDDEGDGGDQTPKAESPQVRELRQYAVRQDEFTQQLEQENGVLREMTEELRGYVKELVNENNNLSDELRTRASESSPEAEARLEACRAEVSRLSAQIVQHEEELTEVHQRQLQRLKVDRDQLTGEKDQLKASAAQAKRKAEEASKRAADAKLALERATLLQMEAQQTTAKLRRELEERAREADRRQMEHERHLLAARGQAERAVRASFEKVQRQLDTQAEKIAELESARQRHQTETAELRSEAQKQEQAAAQARADADSAATRHRQELEALRRRLQAAELEAERHKAFRSEFPLHTDVSTALPLSSHGTTAFNTMELNTLQRNLWTRTETDLDGLDYPAGGIDSYSFQAPLEMAALATNGHLTPSERAWLERARLREKEPLIEPGYPPASQVAAVDTVGEPTSKEMAAPLPTGQLTRKELADLGRAWLERTRLNQKARGLSPTSQGTTPEMTALSPVSQSGGPQVAAPQPHSHLTESELVALGRAWLERARLHQKTGSADFAPASAPAADLAHTTSRTVDSPKPERKSSESDSPFTSGEYGSGGATVATHGGRERKRSSRRHQIAEEIYIIHQISPERKHSKTDQPDTGKRDKLAPEKIPSKASPDPTAERNAQDSASVAPDVKASTSALTKASEKADAEKKAEAGDAEHAASLPPAGDAAADVTEETASTDAAAQQGGDSDKTGDRGSEDGDAVSETPASTDHQQDTASSQPTTNNNGNQVTSTIPTPDPEDAARSSGEGPTVQETQESQPETEGSAANEGQGESGEKTEA